jgi:hypothetical protein
MAVNVPNPGIYQSQLGQHCVNLRDALQQLLNDAAYLNSMGGQSFLTGPMAMASADATAIVGVIGAVTPSNATVQSLQGWLATTEFLWGGQ